MTELRVEVDARAGWAVLTAHGKIFLDTHEPLVRALQEAAAGHEPKIVLDLHEVTVCDSSGLQVLVDIYRQVTASGGVFRLSRARSLVRRVLDITNLTTILVVFDSVDAAVSAPVVPGSERGPGDRRPGEPSI